MLFLKKESNSNSISENPANLTETMLREKYPEILDILLLDRTTKKNIIWANDNYTRHGLFGYKATDQIKPELITGIMENVIVPRVIKSKVLQKIRTKERAEVFTPTRVVKKQNDLIDKNLVNDDLHTYTKRIWLEVSCGEGPYMTTRYDMETGVLVPILKREGFVDRKLKRINDSCNNFKAWCYLVRKAYQASYGYEWSGDSLLLARENLLCTFIDNYQFKWKKKPSSEELSEIATIISYNVFQMDGVKNIIPLSEVKADIVDDIQLSLFEDLEYVQQTLFEDDQIIARPGIQVKIMNWEKNKLEYF